MAMQRVMCNMCCIYVQVLIRMKQPIYHVHCSEMNYNKQVEIREIVEVEMNLSL